MKLFRERMLATAVFGLVLVVSGFGTVHAQTVTGSFWWIDGEGQASENTENVISPVSGFVNDVTGASFTFTANPGEGLRVLRWMRWSRSGSPSATSDYLELKEYGDDNPLVWFYNADYGSPVTLGLVQTWIKYKLTYAGGDTTDQLFTNRVTIADCTAKRTGYSFSGSWTNAVGRAFERGVEKDGSAFGITNHDDSAVVTLYPKWTANRCTLAYELNGGAYGASHPETAEYDREFVVSDPIRTGYGLKEWSISPKPSESASRIVRGDGETRFTNLFTEDGTKVTLTAVWTNCKYRVNFNHYGAESGPDPVIVAYDEAYLPIIIPKKPGSTFLGYYTAATGGDLLWNGIGQPVREKWDIASDQMAHARWEAETYYLTYEANGASGEISSQLITNGVPVRLSDGSGLSYAGCTLLGWARDAKAASPEFALGTTRTFTEATTLYAVWQVSYFLSFNGHGATSGEMPVTMFVHGEAKPLPANAFEKTGYTFGGWAVSAEKADALEKEYDDRQLVKDVSDIPGSTNTLFAVWNTNTYYVAFDKGRGSGEPMETMTFVYDQTQRLAKCTYVSPHELYGFVGWQDGITGELIPDEAVVSNLCAEANATNTLVAKWAMDLSDFSKSMHCDTLDWKLRERGLPDWETNVVAGCGYGTDSCVSQAAGGWNTKDWLEAEVKTNGVLTFAYKWNKSEESDKESLKLAIGFTVKQEVDFADLGREISVEALTPNEWVVTNISVRLTADQPLLFIHLASDAGFANDSICIDQMKWEPEGGFPDLPVTTNAVPVAVTGLVYDDTGKTGVPSGIGYTIVGNVATNAGDHVATATLLDGYVWEGGFAGPTNIAWSIAKGTKDAGGAVFEDATFTYDGTPHSIAVGGNLPSGVSVVYSGDPTDRVPAGTNEVTATFVPEDPDNWDVIPESLQAKLIVTKGRKDVDYVTLEDATFTYDGTSHSISVTNDLPDGVELVYSGDPTNRVEAGTNVVKVSFKVTDPDNYEEITKTLEAKLVVEKGSKDVGGVTFPSVDVEYDGKPHTLSVVGTLPEGVSVAYEGEITGTEPGVYRATARFVVEDPDNWNPITKTLDATLKIVMPPEPPDPTKGYVNIYYQATLEELGATAVPTDHKITIKAEGLPKGLKLVTTTIKEGRTVVGYAYTVEGVPTETFDGVTRVAYVRVTDNKVQTLYKLDLSVCPAIKYEMWSFPDGTNGVAYLAFGVTNFWPDVAVNPKNWSVSGLPSGLKYDSKTGVVAGTPKKAGRFTVKATEKIVGTKYKSTHAATIAVWPAICEPVPEWTDKAYEELQDRTSAKDVKSASGLPSGVKFTAKDITSRGVLQQEAHTFYGTPTKAGTYAVTLTHEDKSKTQFLWTITSADAPEFELKLTETAVDPLTVKATIRQGVAYEWTVTNTLGSKVSASGLPTGLKLVSTKVRDGTKTIGYTYVVKGVPTKAGEFHSVFKTTMNGVTTTTSAAFTVLDLPAWAQGTFNGGSEIGQVSFTVSKAGKVSGKYLESGLTWTLTAASYDRYDGDLSNYVAIVVGKCGSGKSAVAFTNELTVTCDAVGGFATNEFFVAYQNNWKVEPWKTTAKAFPKGGEIVLRPGIAGPNDTVSLKFASSGKVTVKAKIEKSVSASGNVSYYSASGSAVLCPQTVTDATTGAFEGVVFVYLPPKAKTPLVSGYSACVRVNWDGTKFARVEDDE